MSNFLPKELAKLIENSGVTFSENGQSYLLTCPRCQKDKKLWILKHNGYFVCWHCKETENFKGRCEYALTEVLGIPVSELKSKLYIGGIPNGVALDLQLDLFDDEDEDLIDAPLPLDPIEWPFGTMELTNPYAKKGREYLLSRGIDDAIAKEYDIRYWPEKRRVIFPVKRQGVLYGFQARAIFPTEGTPIPKILTSTGLRRERILMFEDRLKGSDHAVICEGPVDALKAHLCGGNIATMGKAVSKAQLEVIRSYGVKTIYIAMDPDAADEAVRLTQELGDMSTRLLLPPANKKDLGECSYQEVYEAFKSAPLFVPGNLFLSLKLT